jgi:predicted thioesterase
MVIGTGASGEVRHVVGEGDTATALGSGDVRVLATPRLLAWCEAATVAALAPLLDGGSTTVGTRVSLEHRRATPVGAMVVARAEVQHVDGRLVRLGVVAEHVVKDAQGTPGEPVVVATGEVTRVVVDRESFVQRSYS